MADEDEPAFIMYTSGTTGRPKGAVLTHRNLLMHAFSNIVTNGLAPGDRVGLSGAPLFHIAGRLRGLHHAAARARTNVLTRSGGFDPVATVDLLERETRVVMLLRARASGPAIVAVPGLADRDLSALRRSRGAPRPRRPRCSAR